MLLSTSLLDEIPSAGSAAFRDSGSARSMGEAVQETWQLTPVPSRLSPSLEAAPPSTLRVQRTGDEVWAVLPRLTFPLHCVQFERIPANAGNSFPPIVVDSSVPIGAGRPLLLLAPLRGCKPVEVPHDISGPHGQLRDQLPKRRLELRCLYSNSFTYRRGWSRPFGLSTGNGDARRDGRVLASPVHEARLPRLDNKLSSTNPDCFRQREVLSHDVDPGQQVHEALIRDVLHLDCLSPVHVGRPIIVSTVYRVSSLSVRTF